MQVIIGILVFGLIALAIIILVIVNFAYKGLRQIREATEERIVRNQKEKEQKDKNPFGEDYFKSSGSSSKTNKKHQQQYQQKAQPRQDSQQGTARRTTTSSGVTIIDERESANKKIFDHDDGEYVEFEEVHN